MENSGTTTFDHVFRSIFTANWTAALVLSACFFLPLAKGCSDNVIYPYAMVEEPISELATWNPAVWVVAGAHCFWLARPYLYGLLLAFALVTGLVIGGRSGLRWINRFLLGWSIAAVGALLILGGTVAWEHWREPKNLDAREVLSALLYHALIGVPPFIVLIVQVVLLRRGRLWGAAIWSQIGWALLSALRFGVWIDPRQALIGGKIALAASLALMELSRLQYLQGKAVFEEPQLRPRAQYSLAYLMIITFAVAVFCTWVLAPLQS